MHVVPIASLVLVLASLVPGQGTTFPPGLDTTSAGYYSNYLGRYPAMRFQGLYGGLSGSNKTRSFKRLELRRESSSGFDNYARSFRNVTLTVSEVDYTKLSDNFGDNMKSATMVFSGSVSWPATTGKPTTVPGPWGQFAQKNDMAIPFGTGGGNSTFVYSGSLGFCVDFEMSGGVLANNAAWDVNNGRDYYHDGFKTNNQYAGGDYAVTPARTGCTDAYFAVWMFSDKLVGGGGQFRGQPFLYNSRPNSMHVGGISINAMLSTPIPFLSSCHNIALDFGKRVIMYPFFTDSVGNHGGQFLTAPFLAGAVGSTVDSQAAFADSNKVLQMTRGASAKIEALPTASPTWFASRLYYPGLGAKIGFGPYPSRVPVVRLK